MLSLLAPARRPPAASIAAAAIEPAGIETTPGEFTQPATWTRIISDRSTTPTLPPPSGPGGLTDEPIPKKAPINAPAARTTTTPVSF